MTEHRKTAAYDFRDAVAVVTGGASGIGEACVRALVGAGARVVVADRSGESARRLAHGLDPEGERVVPHQVDVTSPDEVDGLGAHIEEAFGRLDMAVNSAGVGATGQRIVDHDLEAWRTVLAVNLDATFLSMRMELGLMGHGGSVVNVASILASRGWAGSAAYVASKHAIIGLTRTAALESAAEGIRVNAVSPGFIETPLLLERHDDASQAAIGARHPLDRLGRPAEVADTVLWLLSDSASFVTGADYAVEGGFLAR